MGQQSRQPTVRESPVTMTTDSDVSSQAPAPESTEWTLTRTVELCPTVNHMIGDDILASTKRRADQHDCLLCRNCDTMLVKLRLANDRWGSPTWLHLGDDWTSVTPGLQIRTNRTGEDTIDVRRRLV